jgi:copper chaperone
MKTSIVVDNLKCNGCANTIRKDIGHVPGVESVEVDVDSACVTITHDEEPVVAAVRAKLMHLGYPELDSVHGMAKVALNAKSYVSCAIGKMS